MSKEQSIKALSTQLKQMIGLAMSDKECKSFVAMCFKEAESNEDSKSLNQILTEYNVTIFEKAKVNIKEDSFFLDTDEQIIQVGKIINEEFQHITELVGEEFEEETQQMVSGFEPVEPMKEKLIEKIKKSLFGKTTPTIPLIQTHAIMNFVFAEHNLSKDRFISKVFEGESEDLIQHLQKKFEEDAKNSLVDFIPMISEDLAGTMIKYIIDNYKGVTPQKIERYYMPKN